MRRWALERGRRYSGSPYSTVTKLRGRGLVRVVFIIMSSIVNLYRYTLFSFPIFCCCYCEALCVNRFLSWNTSTVSHMPYWKQNGDGYVLMFHRGNNKKKKKQKCRRKHCDCSFTQFTCLTTCIPVDSLCDVGNRNKCSPFLSSEVGIYVSQLIVDNERQELKPGHETRFLHFCFYRCFFLFCLWWEEIHGGPWEGLVNKEKSDAVSNGHYECFVFEHREFIGGAFPHFSSSASPRQLKNISFYFYLFSTVVHTNTSCCFFFLFQSNIDCVMYLMFCTPSSSCKAAIILVYSLFYIRWLAIVDQFCLFYFV